MVFFPFLSHFLTQNTFFMTIFSQFPTKNRPFFQKRKLTSCRSLFSCTNLNISSTALSFRVPLLRSAVFFDIGGGGTAVVVEGEEGVSFFLLDTVKTGFFFRNYIEKKEDKYAYLISVIRYLFYDGLVDRNR